MKEGKTNRLDVLIEGFVSSFEKYREARDNGHKNAVRMSVYVSRVISSTNLKIKDIKKDLEVEPGSYQSELDPVRRELMSQILFKNYIREFKENNFDDFANDPSIPDILVLLKDTIADRITNWKIYKWLKFIIGIAIAVIGIGFYWERIVRLLNSIFG